jgi:50S ribosomal protein L16 3-hydroxylase
MRSRTSQYQFDVAHLLGGLTPRIFLQRHWQKRPLLIRRALPGFSGLLSREQLIGLARRDDVRARVVIKSGRSWQSHEGPFDRSFLRGLPARNWSLLVHDIDHFLPAARALLDRFDFIGRARLDDLMVSFAAPGGGVGPHVDSYDVFLLQGPGRRRWRVSHQHDLALVENAPLKLLRRFRAEQEWVLDAGDMLYLPPGWAHHGVALENCTTYSIGFRAPAWHDLAIDFLRHLEDQVALQGMYRDATLAPTRQPARIASQMVRKVGEQLARMQWSKGEVTRFLGRHLTEPRAHVVFQRASAHLSRSAFLNRAQREGVRLDLRTQMLYAGGLFFINGESALVTGRARDSMRELADRRRLARVDSSQRGLATLLHEWYLAGYLQLGVTHPGAT